MNEEHFLTSRGPMTAIARWSGIRQSPYVYALHSTEGRAIISELRRNGQNDILSRLYHLATGIQQYIAPTFPGVYGRMCAAVETAIERDQILLVEGWTFGAFGERRHWTGRRSRTPLEAAINAISGEQGFVSFDGRRYVFIERSPDRRVVFRGAFEAVDRNAARDVVTRMVNELAATAQAKADWSAVIDALKMYGRGVQHLQLFVSERSSQPSASSEKPVARSVPPPRAVAPKEKPAKGKLTLVFDVLAEEEHDKPVFFALEAHDGSVKETRYVNDDKVLAHDRIELQWTDLPEDALYSLRLKQADGDVEVVFENIPFAELSGHTDDREAEKPHAPIEDRNEA